MKIRSVIFLLLIANTSLWSQDEVKVFEWERAKTADPDTVFGISFEKMKLTELPAELEQFTKLRVLNVSRNKLTSLPGYLVNFTQLKELNAGRNLLETFPIQVCRLESLQRLILNRNSFDNLPECVGFLAEMRYMDFYDTPLRALPESLTQLKKLEKIDFTGIRFSPNFQESWERKLPNVELVFDAPCDCMN